MYNNWSHPNFPYNQGLYPPFDGAYTNTSYNQGIKPPYNEPPSNSNDSVTVSPININLNYLILKTLALNNHHKIYNF